MKEPVAHNPKRDPEQRPLSLEGATFNRLDRRSYSPPSPPQPSLSNAQITLDYRVHREIFRAIVGNDEAALRSAWCKHQNVSIRAEEAVSLCVEINRFELIRVILDLGAKPDKLKSSLLETLLLVKRFDLVKLLVEAGAPVNNQAGDSEALNRAILSFHTYTQRRLDADFNNEKIEAFDFSNIEFFLKHGARMDATMPEVRRASPVGTSDSIHWLDAHNSNLFLMFETHGVELRTEHNFGEFAHSVYQVHPIEEAIKRGDMARVEELLKAAPLALSSIKNPLSKAILSDGPLEMIKCLINNNCDVNEDGGKPLTYASAQDFINPFSTPFIVMLLLEHGADPAMREAEAFLNACERFPQSLGVAFFESKSISKISKHYDAALRGLIKSSHRLSELNILEAQDRDDPVFKHLSMVKFLVDRGADAYSAMLAWFREPFLAPPDVKPGRDNPTGHYKAWAEFLRTRLSDKLVRDIYELDDRYRAAHGALSRHSPLMQVGDDSRQRASLPSVSDRYCHLMAQVLEPLGECWINSLIVGNHRKIPESMITPSLLQHDSRYKMISDVAAIATVLHPPFMLRQRFIELARATLSDKIKLKESQESNESVLEWLPITNRLVKHFTETALLPSLLSCLKFEAVPYLTSRVLEHIREDLSYIAAEALFEGRSSREIRDFTKRWYALSDKHPILMNVDDEWNSVLEEPISLPNGFVVRDINSVQCLRETGRRMNNCLADGVHATGCFCGRTRILAIFKQDTPVVAMTLEINDSGWQLTEYEGPNYTSPDEGPDAPLTHFKRMLTANEIKFNPTYDRPLRVTYEYENKTSDGMFDKYRNFLDNNRTFLVVPGNYELLRAFEAPGIDVGAFYRRWVVLNDKNGDQPKPLLRDEAIAKCNYYLREMAEAISLFLEYSKKLYENYPESTVKNPDYSPSFR